MAATKIACVGAGSRYYRRALPDLLVTEDLAESEIVLYDLDGERAARMRARAARLAEDAGTGMTVRAVATLDEALEGADFVLASIGGSGTEPTAGVHQSPIHRADRFIPAKYGIYQLTGDTGGPAALMMGLRSVPAFLEVCAAMERRCPGAVLFNHANPMSVICRAVRKYTAVQVVGICHGVQEGIAFVAKLLDVPPEELSCTWVGTNHYYWFTAIRLRGEDVYDRVRAAMQARAGDRQRLAADLSRIHGFQTVYPEDNHILEFYPFLAQVDTYPDRGNAPYWTLRRIDEMHADYFPEGPVAAFPADARERMLAAFQETLDQMALPEARTFEGENTGLALGAMATGKRHVFVANLANQGAVPNLPLDAEVEVEAVTTWRGARPVTMGPAPRALKGILEKRFAWQELVADAAAKGDRAAALQALILDEMAIWPDRAQEMLDELLEASRPYLPRFFETG